MLFLLLILLLIFFKFPQIDRDIIDVVSFK